MGQRKKTKTFGYAPSVLDGSEHVYNAPESLELPEEYDYREFISKVIDQGAEPICVPCSLSTWINWHINMATGSKDDNGVNLNEIFESCGGTSVGMTFKDGLSYLRHHGVSTKKGGQKINEYAMVRNIVSLRNALIANGPCVAALPVYDDTGYPQFWDSTRGSFKGGHAISIVGWTKEGLIIRNSWGKNFGDKGYTILPYGDFSKILEAWTIVR